MMPVYVYECDVCGKRFDLQRQYGSPHPTTCPDGHEGVHRVFSPPTIIFKGSGFYVTDHTSSNGRARDVGPQETGSTKPKENEPKAKTKETEDV